ncbi:M1 family metallopeptidase [soil metagenome]
MPTDADRYRLPRAVVPSRYELTLEPDLDAATFSGSQSVTVDVTEPVDEVILNAQDLDIDEVWLEAANGTRIEASVSLDPETERAHLALGRTAEAGPWVLHSRFRGVLNDKLVGFYRSTFTDESGTEHVIATSQMEATHARKAFPCWDEPDLKATFAVTLVVPDGLAVLSNGAELSDETAGDGRRHVRFAETMRMSTYLVAFVVGPLGLTDAANVDGVPLRVAFPPKMGHLTDFAMESGSFALRWFSDYYGIPYPGGKLDLVAIPDFAFGAMENLGCVTFREIALLVDPARATQPDLQRVADVIHHEIAHMWFGDLVTMKWWNGIWLNEAFATFMEMKCTDAFRPQWERWVDFGISRTAAFDIDSLASTRPIEFDVVSPQEAEGMFDTLTYEKGGAVLRMLEQYLGEAAFRDGVRHYLSSNAYANTETTDLWDAIETATGEPVRRIMDTWIFQGGYPAVGVDLVDRDGTPVLALSQERFRYATGADGGDGDTGDGEPSWSIPIIVRYGTNGSERVDKVLFEGAEATFELGSTPDWVLVNAGASGFYRVRYSAKLMAALGRHGADTFSALERYQLVDDTFASVLAGSTRAAEFLDLARGFVDETDLSVWQRLAGGLGALDRLVDDADRPRFQSTVRALVAPALERLGPDPVEGESERARQLRGTLLEVLGTVGEDPEANERARALHRAYIDDPDAVDPALAAAALNIVASGGGADDFELFWTRHREADNPQKAIRYLHALARFQEPELISRMLDLSLGEVRTQDAPYLLGRGLANRRAGAQVWEFVRRNWETINARFPSNSIVRLVEGVRTFTDPALANDVESFFAEHTVPQGAKTLAQHLERLRVNVALRQREAADLSSALR